MYSECTCQSLGQVRRGTDTLFLSQVGNTSKNPIFAIFFIAKLIESAATIDKSRYVQYHIRQRLYLEGLSSKDVLEPLYFYPLLNLWRGSELVPSIKTSNQGKV